MVGKAGTAIWENETLRAVAGNGLGVAGAVGFGALIHYMVGSIGPSVPLLTPMFSLMVAVPAAIMAFSAIRQQFPSNDVAAERARSRGAEGPALVRTGGLDGPVLERAAEVRPVTYSRLAGVGDIRPTVGVKLDGDPADISVPVLRSETGAILRG